MRWQPQGVRGYPFGGDQESLWSDTQVAGGGYAFPFAATSRAFAQTFPPGTPLVRAVSSDPDIAVLASRTTTLLVNGHSSGQQILLVEARSRSAPTALSSCRHRTEQSAQGSIGKRRIACLLRCRRR